VWSDFIPVSFGVWAVPYALRRWKNLAHKVPVEHAGKVTERGKSVLSDDVRGASVP